jgi:hypothetical protein
MKSFSFNNWLPESENEGESVSALPKQDTSRILSPSAAEWAETHRQRALLCWQRSKLHFWPSISFLADAFRHGALHLIQLSRVFLRRHLGKKDDSLLSTKGMNMLLILLVLLLLVGDGFYFGGPVIGGGIGLILLTCLIIYIMGGFRSSKS